MFGILALALVGYGLYVASSSDKPKEVKQIGPSPTPGPTPADLDAMMKSDLDELFSQADVKARVGRGEPDVEKAATGAKGDLYGVWKEGSAGELNYIGLVLYAHTRDVDAGGTQDADGKLEGMTYIPITDSTAPLSDFSSALGELIAERFFEKGVSISPAEKRDAIEATIQSEKKSAEEAHVKGVVVNTGKAGKWASGGNAAFSGDVQAVAAPTMASSMSMDMPAVDVVSVDETGFAYMPYAPEPPSQFTETMSVTSEPAYVPYEPLAPAAPAAAAFVPYAPPPPGYGMGNSTGYVPVTGYLSFGAPLSEYPAADRLESKLYQNVEEEEIGSTGYQVDPYTYV